MEIRKAVPADLDGAAAVYEQVIGAEERGAGFTGWRRGVYPTYRTAEQALARGDLFVLEEGGEILGAAVINQLQVDVYAGAPWRYDAPDERVCVLHTLAVAPRARGRGYGRAFVAFYEERARALGCTELRMDTNLVNLPARAMYRRLGFAEIGCAVTGFNGIPGVELILLEKHLEP